MNIDEFQNLLEAYGSRESRWPEEKRAQMLTLIAHDGAARTLLNDHEAFDHALDRSTVNPNISAMRTAILDRLPGRSWSEKFLSWLWPADKPLEHIWRPAIAASLPLMVGMVLGTTMNLDNMNAETNEWQEAPYWLVVAADETELLP